MNIDGNDFEEVPVAATIFERLPSKPPSRMPRWRRLDEALPEPTSDLTPLQDDPRLALPAIDYSNDLDSLDDVMPSEAIYDVADDEEVRALPDDVRALCHGHDDSLKYVAVRARYILALRINHPDMNFEPMLKNEIAHALSFADVREHEEDLYLIYKATAMLLARVAKTQTKRKTATLID